MTSLNPLRDLIAKAKVENVYAILAEYNPQKSSYFNEDMEAFRQLHRGYLIGLVTDEDYRGQRAKLVARLLEDVDELEKRGDQEVLASILDAVEELEEEETAKLQRTQQLLRFDDAIRIVFPVAIFACLILSVIYGWYWIQISIGLFLILYLLRD